eukprot:TRINITY_DN4760_c0_g5_i1.p1 TRINITY_DN4760_c0_g5~~TRINITY_DN4760_c0_g5_i1.p1  ORF type:complete len:387 (+),score=40.78 TRINITY_DN4760_c0_g5_i1:76-1236(+)
MCIRDRDCFGVSRGNLNILLRTLSRTIFMQEVSSYQKFKWNCCRQVRHCGSIKRNSRVWTSPDSELRLTQEFTAKDPLDEVLCVQYSKADQYLAAGTGAGKIHVYNTAGKLHSTLAASYALMPITALCWTRRANEKPQEILISGSADGSVIYWNVDTGQSLATLNDRNFEIYSIDVSKAGTHLATGSRDCSIKLYDCDKRALIVLLKPGDSTVIGHSNRVHSVKFTEDPNVVVSGGSDRTVFIWDLRVGKSVGYVHGPHVCGNAIDVTNDTMLTGSFDKDKVLQLWSISKRKLIQDVGWQADNDANGYVNAARFEKTLRNRYIAASGHTGVNKNEVRIFNNKGKYEMVGRIELDKPAVSIDFVNAKQSFAVGTVDGFVYVFNYCIA